MDSAVTAIVQAYLDSIASDPTAHAQGLPSWTKEIAGKKFGIDSKNIYIAGLKIPAVVLALLPIPAGNLDQNRAYNHLMDLRADLHDRGPAGGQPRGVQGADPRDAGAEGAGATSSRQNQRTAPAPADTATP